MPIANRSTYLLPLAVDLLKHWPGNRLTNIVCHGHSVPAGYFRTPEVRSLDAYPHLLKEGLDQRYPFAVLNVIVTAIGGENSPSGANRFTDQVLCHRPDLLTIDYGLNDRYCGLPESERAWRSMIEAALARQVRVILLTPTHDLSRNGAEDEPNWPAFRWRELQAHAEQIRRLADEYSIGLVDSFAIWEAHYAAGGDLLDLLSASNHPNRLGHDLVARELLRWFPLP